MATKKQVLALAKAMYAETSDIGESEYARLPPMLKENWEAAAKIVLAYLKRSGWELTKRAETIR